MTDIHRRTPSSSRLSPEEITNRGFASAFRGVSETEVRNFLRRVADDLAAMRTREADLNREIEELREQLANPPPVTEQQLLDALGEETARVLRSAQDAADDMRKRAEERAVELVQEAKEHAVRLREEAEQQAAVRTQAAERRATELEQESESRAGQQREAADREATELRETAAREVDALRELAEETATAVVENAKATSHELVTEARTVRERVLADLARRRSLLQAQVDELRSGRDRLLDAYRIVKHTLSDATHALAQVEARANAELAAPLPQLSIPPVDGELEVLELDAPSPPTDDDGDDTVEIDLEVESVVVIDDGTGDRETPDAEDSGAAVDALFARLRASHTADPVPGEPMPADPAEVEPAAEPAAPALDPAGADAGPTPSEPANEPAPPAAPKASTPKASTPKPPKPPKSPKASGPKAAEAKPADEKTGADTKEAAAPAPTGDDALRAERAEALGPITHELGRRAKRALQDQQNEILDKIRTIKGKVESAAVLAAEDAQESAWATVLREPLTKAYATSYAATPGADAPAPELPTELLSELAEAMVQPWRRRLISAIDGVGDDSEAITQRLGARYREYRGKELDGVLGDALATAWARGTFDAAPEGRLLRWVPAEVGRCADCDDNALEPTARTEPFPTGQLFPPAHPGCRCFLAVAEPDARSG